MGLYNTKSLDGYLLALNDDATASSELITQDMLRDHFRNIKNSRAVFNLFNLSILSTADTLLSYMDLTGKSLTIVNDNGFDSFIPTSSVLGTTIVTLPILTPPHTTGWLNNYVYECFAPKIITKFYVNFYVFNTGSIYGSFDGTNYTKILDVPYNHDIDVEIDLSSNIHAYKYYKFSNNNNFIIRYIEEREFAYEIDTSSITNGTIPNTVFIIPILKINNYELIRNNVIYEDSSKLTYVIYDNLQMYPIRTIELLIELNKNRNKMIEFNYLGYELDLITSNATLTSNILPKDNISVFGSQSAGISAYNLFDGDVSTNAFSVTTGSDKVFELIYKYTFDTPTTVFSTKIDFELASEAVSSYKVEGSLDDITYVTLLDIVDQAIALDDYIQVKRLDIEKYDAYKYYRISFTKGNTASATVSCKQFYLLGEK